MELLNKNIFVKNFIKFILLIIPFVLLYFNYDFSKTACSYLDIPFDLTLTMISPGFGFDITIVLTVIETGFLIWIANKFKLLN